MSIASSTFCLLFLTLVVLYSISSGYRVRAQTFFKCRADACAGHIGDVMPTTLETTLLHSITLWIAPDDVIVTQIPDLTPEPTPIPCPGSNLKATVTRALRLTLRQVVVRPLCLEGLVLYKTRVSMLVDPKGPPTYCALIVSSADRFRISDTVFDHSECVNAITTTTTSTSVLTADQTAAIVLRPRGSRLDSQTTCHNLTFRTSRDASVVAVLLSPPTWEQTLRLDGPSFTAIRSHNSHSNSSSQRMRFVMLLVAGRLTLNDFKNMSVIILRDPVAGLDHRSHTLITTHVVPWMDLWQDMDARVLMRLRQASELLSLLSPSPSSCLLTAPSTSHSTTLIAVGFSLAGVLAICVVILLVHSCRSIEAQDLAPYRSSQDHARPTS